MCNTTLLGPHYFETIGTRLLSGRPIEERDTPSSGHVVVINDAFSRKFFSHADALGKHLGFNGISHAGDYEIVGVVEDTKYIDPKIPAEPMVFLPLLQTVTYEDSTEKAYQVWGNYIDGVQLHVVGRPENFQTEVRNALAEIDPNLTAIKITNLGRTARFQAQQPTPHRPTHLLVRSFGPRSSLRRTIRCRLLHRCASNQ